MKFIVVGAQARDVSPVTPIATAFGPAWETTPTPFGNDPRWRAVFGHRAYATRLINTLAHRYLRQPLGTMAATLRAQYAEQGRFDLPDIGVAGTAYLLAALGETTFETPDPPQQVLATQLHTLADAIRQQVTPDSVATLAALLTQAQHLAEAAA